MKKSALLVALSAASLAGGIAIAQTQPQTTKPYGADTKPETTRPATGDPTPQHDAARQEQGWRNRQARSQSVAKPVRGI